MAEYEKKFALRQANDLAEGLGKFLADDAVENILKLPQQDEQKVLLDKIIAEEIEKFKQEERKVAEEDTSPDKKTPKITD